MGFLLSFEGLIYNVPAVALLGFLCWKRTYVGLVIATLAVFRVLMPLMGLPHVIPFSVHMTLGVVAAASWNRDDWTGNGLLFVSGVALMYFTEFSVGHLLPRTTEVQLALGKGFLVGLGIAGARTVLCGVLYVLEVVGKD